MNKYIATFHSHFGAMSYFKALKKQGVAAAKIMPVPRKVSSSCGSCVSYEHNAPIDMDDCELDAIYQDSAEGLVCVLSTLF
ncbi:MAG: DUF3343 domain-containing protein [Clostridiales bacterium]|jgi:hypothetical protein|nr:DUF3343 domain-containing protein [Clostridiales bacterium]